MNGSIGDGALDSTTLLNQQTGSGNFRIPLIILTSLFFMWGFITCLNDILIPHLKSVFDLSYTQAMLVQFCFFGAYALVSVPAGYLVKRVGFKNGIIIGLFTASLGCLLFYPAAEMRLYPIFLIALFVLASGITILQVSANPYVTILGKPETAASRLTLTQAFNSLGTTLAPFFGGVLILGVATVGASELAALSPEEIATHHAAQAQAVQIPYLILTAALFTLAAIFTFLKFPVINLNETMIDAVESSRSAWSYRHLTLGVLCIFFYVGAEVSIGSFLVSFLAEENIAGLEEQQAANYIAYFWGGAMLGRFIGAAVMMRISATRVLTFNATAAAAFVLVAILGEGSIAMWAILAVGLFNSIMFPTIFSLALKELGPATSQGSGALCLAIVGGAIIPLIQGLLADNIGIQMSFVLPILCYIYIMFYGLKWSIPLSDKA